MGNVFGKLQSGRRRTEGKGVRVIKGNGRQYDGSLSTGGPKRKGPPDLREWHNNNDNGQRKKLTTTKERELAGDGSIVIFIRNCNN